MHHLAALPVPEAHPPTTIPTRDETAVRTDAHIGPIPSGVVPSEALLAVLPEAVARGVDYDLVISALEGDAFP